MKFKAEATLLVIAIALFAVAVFFYTSQTAVAQEYTTLSQSTAFPYRGIAYLFVGVGSLSMITASISYSKKSKDLNSLP